jgi:hypothetical protein
VAARWLLRRDHDFLAPSDWLSCQPAERRYLSCRQFLVFAWFLKIAGGDIRHGLFNEE